MINQPIQSIAEFIQQPGFPCVGARSALATGGVRYALCDDLRDNQGNGRILAALRGTGPIADAPPALTTTLALFPQTPILDEKGFERHLWRRLQSLHDLDSAAFDWDPSVSSDPTSEHFAMSFGGAAYFIVGMHPAASRLARRSPFALLAFNSHAQFQRLKEQGRYDRVRDVVRRRDIAIQGEANPMLADHGDVSEASQYSGRQVPRAWTCPFRSHVGDAHGA